MKRVFSLILIMCMIMSLTACDSISAISEEPVSFSMPVVTYEDNNLYINGEFITSTETLNIYRIDNKVVSLRTDSGMINITPDGKEIKFTDIFIDRDLYEEGIETPATINSAVTSTDFYMKYLDMDAMMEVVGSYDEAMKLDFSIDDRGVVICYPFVAEVSDETTLDAVYSVMVPYGEMINTDYFPVDGVSASGWVSGNLRYYPSNVDKDVYKKTWVLNSLELKNYNDTNYYWLCMRYEKDSETYPDTIYYSIVCTRDDVGNKYIIYSQKVDEPFTCCNVQVLENIIDSLK